MTGLLRHPHSRAPPSAARTWTSRKGSSSSPAAGAQRSSAASGSCSSSRPGLDPDTVADARVHDRLGRLRGRDRVEDVGRRRERRRLRLRDRPPWRHPPLRCRRQPPAESGRRQASVHDAHAGADRQHREDDQRDRDHQGALRPRPHRRHEGRAVPPLLLGAWEGRGDADVPPDPQPHERPPEGRLCLQLRRRLQVPARHDQEGPDRDEGVHLQHARVRSAPHPPADGRRPRQDEGRLRALQVQEHGRDPERAGVGAVRPLRLRRDPRPGRREGELLPLRRLLVQLRRGQPAAEGGQAPPRLLQAGGEREARRSRCSTTSASSAPSTAA